MKHHLLQLLIVFMLTAVVAAAASAADAAGDAAGCRMPGSKAECDMAKTWCGDMKGSCTPEMRGRCGKRRGDWYGASQPVASAGEARKILLDYFSGQGYAVSEIVEGKWGYSAEILGKDGKAIDRVLIDRRSGRIRSIY